MTQGIHVYGSASMGALRAVELAAFGMEGVGAIFEAYRDGRLEDDDEVAVAHGPAETGFRPLSVAMANIRCTLLAARKARVIGSRTRTTLERIGKRLFYPDRTYARILQGAAEAGVAESELRALREWLPQGEVNQKRADAIAMLRVMRGRLAADPELKRVIYPFEYTETWDQSRHHAGELGLDEGGRPDGVPLDRLLDELRLQGEAYVRARQGALLRSLALEETWRLGIAIMPEMLEETAGEFRQDRGLLESADVQRWLAAQHLDHGQFMRLMEEEARLRWLEGLADREVASRLPDHLRATGEYGRLLNRARDKQRVLDSCGLSDPALEDSGLSEAELLRWYFETRLGRPVPPDMARHARSVGFEDQAALRRSLLREFLYSGRKA
jgi:hypothetical protein